MWQLLNINKEGESTNFLGNVPMLRHPHSAKMIADIQVETPVFKFVPIASGPVNGHHWEEPASLFTCSSESYMH